MQFSSRRDYTVAHALPNEVPMQDYSIIVIPTAAQDLMHHRVVIPTAAQAKQA
jgi:hypothetical protein